MTWSKGIHNYLQSSDREDVWLKERLTNDETKQLSWVSAKLGINRRCTTEPSLVHVYPDNFPSNANVSQVQASWPSSAFEGSRLISAGAACRLQLCARSFRTNGPARPPKAAANVNAQFQNVHNSKKSPNPSPSGPLAPSKPLSSALKRICQRFDQCKERLTGKLVNSVVLARQRSRPTGNLSGGFCGAGLFYSSTRGWNLVLLF